MDDPLKEKNAVEFTQGEGRRPERNLPWFWLAGGGIVIASVCLFAVGLILPGLLESAPGPALQPSVPVRSPHATFTSTVTLSPSPTRSPRPTATVTPTLDATQFYEQFAPQLTAARQVLEDHRYEQAIPMYDALITAMPNFTKGYYNRGVAYHWAASYLHSLWDFETYNRQSIQDIDQSILLGPYKGSYFITRGLSYWSLDNTVEYTVDRRVYTEVALQNVLAGVAQGQIEPHTESHLVFLYTKLGRCQEAAAEGERQLAAWPVDEGLSGTLNINLALAYLCLERYSQGLEQINIALDTSPSNYENIVKTSLQYNMGDLNGALETISASLAEDPTFHGIRYYQRALIQYDLGNLEEAWQDLEIGEGYTWYHGGIYGYLRGLQALEEGDRESALWFFQFAEAACAEIEGPSLERRIRRDLAALGGKPLDPTPSVVLQITPLPTSLFTPVPTVFPVEPSPTVATPQTHQGLLPGFESAQIVMVDGGLGRRVLKPNETKLYQFMPFPEVKVREVKEMALILLPQQEGNAALQIELWDLSGRWVPINAYWGETEVDDPGRFVFPGGDLIITVRSLSADAIEIDNLSFRLTVEDMNGQLVSYGLLP